MSLVRFIISLPPALNEQMREAAEARGETMAVWVRDAIREKLAREKS